MLSAWCATLVVFLALATASAEEQNASATSESLQELNNHNGHNGHQPSIAGYGLWIGFCIVVVIGLALDHLLSKQFVASGHAIRGAIYSSAGWIGLAMMFALVLAMLKGGSAGSVFLTGYLVEESLSVDNLVVIALIFKSFHIKPHNQGPVLKWGILGAVVFRLIFVFVGVWLLEHLRCMIYVFGGVLLWSAWKMYNEEEEEENGMDDHTKGNSWMMRILTSIIPYRAEAKDSKVQGFIEHVDGKAYATPMLAALVVVELSDLLFAVDSIPCILGLTHDLFLVFSSNMFAILGLRSLYLLLAEALDNVQNLKVGLAVILAFVGIKMMLGEEWFPVPQSFSLFIILGVLGVTVVTSMMGINLGKSKTVILPM
eukprot:gnl/TRDRNA2_/TRDRNA2_189782_c0_seq1.p1 gnl/TRDRNA2_/TRDRNA2_189782_c0~~gnl/TRDRNA2_/TRDRNA2_189782_c0_seq1.p1  ORF type:complete len:371 (-),score=42.80 gnl/TRDRNA2_/TRDRNA2_189782_c0_seq1:233-1345(-)